MALRLIEMVVQEQEAQRVRSHLKDEQMLEYRQVRLSDGEVLIRILLEAEQDEAVLEVLEKECSLSEGKRVVVLSVEATLPCEEAEPPAALKKLPERIGREELYESIKDAARCTRVYLMMMALSTVVATVGLQYNSVPIIIGAMVMAPLIGPNMALALGTMLGDWALLRNALGAILAGIGVAILVSGIIGAVVPVELTVKELASHMRIGLGNTLVALASGCAGALSFTTGVSTTLIGVMVAVALLPPLVAFGLLLGSGQPVLACVALMLFLMNLICVNLAGVLTFLVQGIHPVNWWEKGRAAKQTRIAICIWVGLLVVLVTLNLLAQSGVL